MKKLLVLPLLLLAALSCRTISSPCSIPGPGEQTETSTDTPPGDALTLRLVQYNVGAFNKSGSSTIGMVADMMKELRADVVSLNEVDSVTTRTGKVDQIKEFAEMMGGWHYRYAWAISFQGGKYGVCAAARADLQYKQDYVVHLPKGDGREERAVAVMEFDRFVFAATHLDLTPDSQMEQVRAINDFFNGTFTGTEKPVFLCGDFNAVPGSDTINALLKDWKIISRKGNTYSAVNPRKHIDYVFLWKRGRDVQVTDSGICTDFSSGDVTVASDHLPIYVDIVL